ncbi:hypothetical protein NO995_07175 [Aestuariibaculum sp. M13]|uniref:hypothetical protein n=1 Tax=Aestuariibaculum sp. M13 TaxID=2967132 RepID=UPI002159C725|nr:hypothetical protein [Aestuariibaculum sp. M13]MCR8667455.1 hypothetical protein [Aestuariibaculum sp. M13]
MKYPIIRVSNLLSLILFLFFTNTEGAEYVGLYFFYTIYLWLLIVLGIVEINLLKLNKNGHGDYDSKDKWFFRVFVVSLILIIFTMVLLHIPEFNK